MNLEAQILAKLNQGGGRTLKFEEFTISGLFTPSQALLDAGGLVEIELRGSTGGGGPSLSVSHSYTGSMTVPGGPGGDSYLKTAAIVTGPIAVTIAAAAAIGADGGVSSFGNIVCEGGKRGGAGQGRARYYYNNGAGLSFGGANGVAGEGGSDGQTGGGGQGAASGMAAGPGKPGRCLVFWWE